MFNVHDDSFLLAMSVASCPSGVLYLTAIWVASPLGAITTFTLSSFASTIGECGVASFLGIVIRLSALASLFPVLSLAPTTLSG